MKQGPTVTVAATPHPAALSTRKPSAPRTVRILPSIRPSGTRRTIQEIALSPNGKWLASLEGVGGFYREGVLVRVHSVASGRTARSYTGDQLGESLLGLAWHPRQALLAVSGGHEFSPLSGGGEFSSFMLLDVERGKVTKVPLDGDAGALAWLADGRHILSRGTQLLDTKVGKTWGTAGLWAPDLWPAALACSAQGTIAVEISDEASSRVWLYRPVANQPRRFTELAEVAVSQPEGQRKSSAYPTRPAFLADGRLVYLRWRVLWRQPEPTTPQHGMRGWDETHGGETARVEVWVADGRGRSSKLWLRIPDAHIKNYDSEPTERLFTVSADGRTIAYVRDGLIKVVRVTPPK